MDDYKLLYGDIHNHNAHGYGVGSIERSLDIARSHLDFFGFTGHSSWHDMPVMEGNREKHWSDGFRRLKDTWPRVQRVIADGNRDDEFSAFLGFEWHSSRWGDQCVLFPGDDRPLFYTSELGRLREFCAKEDALMIPHHLAYPSGNRGVNWDAFDSTCTPVVEVYSEHGNGESDRGAYPYFSHSMGGRQTSNTARSALSRGLQFGFVGSSDNHAGFPGAYGEGLMGVWVVEHSRAGIIEAIRARRTYALTGDRIEVEFTANGQPMGSSVRAGKQVEMDIRVQCRDELDAIELIQDGHIVHRDFPVTDSLDDPFGSPIQVRMEWGWGPWGALALDRICDWRFRINVRQGRLLRSFACLQSMPFDEERRHRILNEGPNHISVQSYTARDGAYRENPNQSLVLEIDGDAATTLEVSMAEPSSMQHSVSLGQLLEGSRNLSCGPFPKESWQWHRLVVQQASAVRRQVILDAPDHPSYAYLRVRQTNGQMAWVSPVFINYSG